MNYQEVENVIAKIIAESDYKRLGNPQNSFKTQELFDVFLKHGEDAEKEIIDAYLQEADERDELREKNFSLEKEIIRIVHLLISLVYADNTPVSKYIKRLTPKAVIKGHSRKVAERKVKSYYEYKEEKIAELEKAKAKKERLAKNKKIKTNLKKVGYEIRINKNSELYYDVILVDAKAVCLNLGLLVEEMTDDTIFNELAKRGYKYKNGEFIK